MMCDGGCPSFKPEIQTPNELQTRTEQTSIAFQPRIHSTFIRNRSLLFRHLESRFHSDFAIRVSALTCLRSTFLAGQVSERCSPCTSAGELSTPSVCLGLGRSFWPQITPA